MRHTKRRAWHHYRPAPTTLAAAVGSLALLLPATVMGADSASAAPAVGYTASTQPPTFTSGPSTTFVADTNNSYAISVQGDPAPTLTTTGNLPPGVQLSGSLLEGEPSALSPGIYPFTITASNAAGTATQSFTLTVAEPVAVGAEGTDGQLWVQAPQLGPGWHPEGGQIVGPPAVAAAPNAAGSTPAPPLFIATGTTKHLYVRSLTVGWQELGPAPASCAGAPAAVITGTATLTVACRGLDSALWVNTTTWSGTGLPHMTSGWTSLGGVLTAAPATALVDGTMTFFVRGTTGHIYIRTLSAGFAEQSWACIGAPGATLQEGSETIFACEGTNQALWESGSDAGGWTPATSEGGSLISGPAVTTIGQPQDVLAEGTDHAVWAFTYTGFGSWSSLGGDVVGGVGAAPLLT